MAEPSILITKFSHRADGFNNTSVPCDLSSCCKSNPHYSKVFPSSNESMLNVFYIKYQMVASAGVCFLCGRRSVCDGASNKKMLQDKSFVPDIVIQNNRILMFRCMHYWAAEFLFHIFKYYLWLLPAGLTHGVTSRVTTPPIHLACCKI